MNKPSHTDFKSLEIKFSWFKLYLFKTSGLLLTYLSVSEKWMTQSSLESSNFKDLRFESIQNPSSDCNGIFAHSLLVRKQTVIYFSKKSETPSDI